MTLKLTRYMFAQVHLQKLSKWERQGKLGGSMKSSGNWSSHTWSACRLGYWSFLGGISMSWLWGSHLGDDDQWASSPRWDIFFLPQSFLFIITISIIIKLIIFIVIIMKIIIEIIIIIITTLKSTKIIFKINTIINTIIIIIIIIIITTCLKVLLYCSTLSGAPAPASCSYLQTILINNQC